MAFMVPALIVGTVVSGGLQIAGAVATSKGFDKNIDTLNKKMRDEANMAVLNSENSVVGAIGTAVL